MIRRAPVAEIEMAQLTHDTARVEKRQLPFPRDKSDVAFFPQVPLIVSTFRRWNREDVSNRKKMFDVRFFIFD